MEPTLYDQILPSVQMIDGKACFEGKNGIEWMQAMMTAENEGKSEREINRMYRISGILECLDDTEDE